MGDRKARQRAFFDRVVTWSGFAPDEIVYVGDHRDNDVLPAHDAGLLVAHIRRGPWGHLWATDPHLRAAADWQTDTLTELPLLLSPAVSHVAGL